MTDPGGGNDAGAQATTHHGSGGFARPPALPEDGREYEEWKKMVKLWSKFTKFGKKERASVVTVNALQGEARSVALALEEEVLDADDGLDKLISELDKLYLKDKDMLGYESWKKISKYKRPANSSILSYCAEYRRIRSEAKKYDIVISDTTFSFMLLDNSGFSEEQKMLILSIALSKSTDGKMKPDDIEAAMRRIQSSSGGPSTSSSNNDIFETHDFDYCENQNFGEIDGQCLTQLEKEEIVEHAMYTMQNRRPNASYNNNSSWNSWNKRNQGHSNGKQSFSQRFSNNSSGPNKRFHSQQPQQQAPMVNPRDKQTGEIMKCLSCHSRFHLYRSIQCPNNAKAMMAELENDPEDTLNVENVETIFASERDFITSQPTSTNGKGVVP